MTDPARGNGNGAKPQQDMIAGPYLRNAWYVAAWSDDVADGKLLPRTVMDEPIVLYRKVDGNVAAIANRCAHRFAPLSMGKIVSGDRTSARITALSSTARAPACAIRTAPRTFRRGRGSKAIR